MTSRGQTTDYDLYASAEAHLIERETELSSIQQQLDRVVSRSPQGGVVLIEAPAGAGKTELVRTACELASQSAIRVVKAQGSELEAGFPFGVAMQLFEPIWLELEPAERSELSEGHAQWAAGLLSGTRPVLSAGVEQPGFDTIHGLYWFARYLAADRAAEPQPLAIVVDDAHLTDRPSLRFLAYLADRIAELPIALVLARRPGVRSPDDRALTALSGNETTTVVSPGPLSEAGIGELVRAQFPDAEPQFCNACAKVTGGNPFLLAELLQQLREDGSPPDRSTATRLSELAPDSVLNAVVARLGVVHQQAATVATAVAVLGSGAPLRRVARLTGLDPAVTSEAADALAAAHLLNPGEPLSFVHPVVASAVHAAMSPLDRGQCHRRAAELLRDEHAPSDWVAAHVMKAPPASDPWAVEALRSAAANSLASGSTDAAIRLLRRALAEPPGPDARGRLHEELAQAEALAGSARATERLGDAVLAAGQPDRRAELALSHGRALYAHGRYRESAQALDEALGDDRLERDQLLKELAAAYISAASLVPELRSSAAERHRNRLERATAPGPGDGPLGDAHRALEESITGSPRAEVRALVDRAWAGGKLLDLELVDGIGWQLALAALLFADELERALELCDAVQSGAPATLHREASSYRAWLLFEQGRVDEAATAARHGFEAPPGRWRTHFVTAQGVLAGCQVHQGELDAAERTLAIIREPAFENSLRYPFLLEARAQLRLAQHRPEEARADALEAGQRLDATFGEAGPGTLAWRSTAAFALIAMSEPDQARDLAQAELELAQQQSLIRVVMRDLRVLGLVAGGREGLELIGRAVEIGRGGPSRLEYLHALVDYGAALRRANRRAAAREPLRDALDRSLRAGAGALAERAREELAATGSRPRTEVRSGLESLTPSERRVAELAADGLTTRQVAETLFVSRKTVEFHLRQIYRKLSVKSRPQLAETMREQAA